MFLKPAIHCANRHLCPHGFSCCGDLGHAGPHLWLGCSSCNQEVRDG